MGWGRGDARGSPTTDSGPAPAGRISTGPTAVGLVERRELATGQGAQPPSRDARCHTRTHTHDVSQEMRQIVRSHLAQYTLAAQPLPADAMAAPSPSK